MENLDINNLEQKPIKNNSLLIFFSFLSASLATLPLILFLFIVFTSHSQSDFTASSPNWALYSYAVPIYPFILISSIVFAILDKKFLDSGKKKKRWYSLSLTDWNFLLVIIYLIIIFIGGGLGKISG